MVPKKTKDIDVHEEIEVPNWMVWNLNREFQRKKRKEVPNWMVWKLKIES